MRTSSLWMVAVLMVVGIHAAAQTGSDQNKDKQEIRALEDRFAAAVRAKDIDSVMKTYAPGAQLFVFDVTPPRQYVGFDAYRKDWQEFLAAFPGPVDKFEVQDLNIETDGTLAYSHSIQPLVATAKNGSKFSFTARVTDGYRKINGKWLITLEHVSVPVDLDTGKADLASTP